MSLAEAALQVGKSPGYLRVAIRRGILKGQKVGNSWGVTQAALNDYADNHLGRIGRPSNPVQTKDKRGSK